MAKHLCSRRCSILTMRSNPIKIWAYLLLPMLFIASAAVAQRSTVDNINPYRVIQRSTLHGVSLLNTLDTYLSGFDYRGGGYHVQHETLRKAHTGSYDWIYQTRTDATLGISKLRSSARITFMASRKWSGYHPFEINKKFKILLGPQLKAECGVLYAPSYGNNPVSAKVNASLGASAIAVYAFNVKDKEYKARYTLDLPLVGAMFAPEYGQSYYEIFGLGDTDNIIQISTPINSPSFTQSLSLDVPMKNSKLRFAYMIDIYQSDVNSLRTHIYTHSFSVGYARTIYKVKRHDPIEAYLPL